MLSLTYSSLLEYLLLLLPTFPTYLAPPPPSAPCCAVQVRQVTISSLGRSVSQFNFWLACPILPVMCGTSSKASWGKVLWITIENVSCDGGHPPATDGRFRKLTTRGFWFLVCLLESKFSFLFLFPFSFFLFPLSSFFSSLFLFLWLVGGSVIWGSGRWMKLHRMG